MALISHIFRIITTIFLSLISSPLMCASKTCSVNDYGAKGDGKSDDTKAFMKTWKDACAASNNAVILVPSKYIYLVKPITFTGPCKSPLTMQIDGKILASEDQSDYEKDTRHWIVFKRSNNLRVQGSGTIDGNGKIWWDSSCKIKKSEPCNNQAPTALLFQDTHNLVVNNIKVQNGQQIVLSFERCTHVKASGLTVTAPEYSPNTDGIHITNSQNVEVSNTIIGTGDDCISIEDGTHMVRARNITCGPGHGISIGSLGDKDTDADVSDILVNTAILTQTTNGLRIKTYQGGSGIARKIVFKNIYMNDVKNPIIIDQNYCDRDEPCTQQKSAVQVRDVTYQNIKGTSSSSDAVIFKCSSAHPCQDIKMDTVQITSSSGDKPPKAECDNVELSRVVDVSPKC